SARFKIYLCVMLSLRHTSYQSAFFVPVTATTETYTLSLHDALPISVGRHAAGGRAARHGVFVAGRSPCRGGREDALQRRSGDARSEEYTSELQSRENLVCRLLLEKKNNIFNNSMKHKQNRIRVIDT